MSFTLDANVLLYASDETSPRCRAARELLDGVAAGTELVYLFWPVLMAYLRVATHPAIFERPLTPADALGNVEALLGLPQTQTAGEGRRFWRSYQRLASDADARGNIVPDAHLVALMEENGVRTIWTHDRDFRRFPGVQVRDPFATI